MFCSTRPSIDSFADRLNCNFTVWILTLVALLLAARTAIHEPIYCSTPSHFTVEQAQVVDKVCWSSSVFRKVPVGLEEMEKSHRKAYYKWVPVLLLLQGFLFYVPKLFWILVSSHFGVINIQHLTSAAVERQKRTAHPDRASQLMTYMVTCLGRSLAASYRKWKSGGGHQSAVDLFWCMLGGAWTFSLYALVKVMYVVNVLGQLFLLDAFLTEEEPGLKRNLYGTQLLSRFLSDSPWKPSDRLPLMVTCDYETRPMGNVVRHSLTCSLPLNLWLEMLFLFLWFWFVFVAIVTIGSLVRLVVSVLNTFYQKRYCRLRLVALHKADEDQCSAENNQLSEFVNNFMSRDAWLTVMKVGQMTGDPTASELICGLWETYVGGGKQGRIDCRPDEKKSVAFQ